MEQETVTITKEEFDRLKKKSEIADDALIQLEMGLQDIKEGRVSKF